MKLTREQINRREAQAPADWHYDWQYAVIHSEHTLTREVFVDADHVLVAHIMYRDERGATRWQTTGRQIPTLHLSLYHIQPSGAGVSHGLGKWIDMPEEVQSKKNYAVLCKLADRITDDDIMDYYNADRKYLDEGKPLFA